MQEEQPLMIKKQQIIGVPFNETGCGKALLLLVLGEVGPLENRKRRHQQIGQKYTENTPNPMFCIFFLYFCPILRVRVLSYPVGGQLFPNACAADK